MQEEISRWTTFALRFGFLSGLASSVAAILWMTWSWVPEAMLVIGVVVAAFALGIVGGILSVFVAWLIYVFVYRLQEGRGDRGEGDVSGRGGNDSSLAGRDVRRTE